MYCNRCGSIIKDTTRPCPTCGLINSNMNYNINNNMNVNNNMGPNNMNYNMSPNGYANQPKRTNGIVTFVIVGVVVMGLFFLASVIGTSFSSMAADNDSGVYNGVNYTLKYDPKVWYKHKSDSDYFILRNRGDSNALFLLPTEYTILGNYNLASDYDRNVIYTALVKQFQSTSEIKYTNIMSSLKSLPETSYYYMSSDFYSYEYNYGGRAYVLISTDAKFMLCLLREGDKTANQLESEVFDLFENLTM